METERTLLRHWNSSDAPRLFELAKDKEIGPNCGWNPHRDVKESAVSYTHLTLPTILRV